MKVIKQIDDMNPLIERLLDSEEENWLECVPWDGEERDLPVGSQTRIPGFRAINLVKFWEVLDSESEEGFKLVAASKLQTLLKKIPDTIVIGAQMNENSVKRLVGTYGKRFFVAKHTGSSRLYNRWEWKKSFKTDVLELEALKQLRSQYPVHRVGR